MKDFCLGDWVLVKFPHKETGKQRKLSCPWHGPYRIASRDDPDVKFTTFIQIQSNAMPNRVPWRLLLIWRQQHSPGWPPKWVKNLMERDITRQLSEGMSAASVAEESDTLDSVQTDSGECLLESVCRHSTTNSRYPLKKIISPDRLEFICLVRTSLKKWCNYWTLRDSSTLRTAATELKWMSGKNTIHPLPKEMASDDWAMIFF